MHWIKVYDLPQLGPATRGKAIVNLLNLGPNERMVAMAATKDFPEDRFLVFATKNGLVKKTALSAYSNVRSGGIIAINLEEKDELLSVRITDGERQIFIGTHQGQGIRFSEKDVRPMGRDTTGVIGVSLKKDEDYAVEMDVVEEKGHLLTVTEKGYGKRSEVSEYRFQGRGGSGVINIKVTEKNGPVVGIKSVSDADQLLLITQSGMLIRIKVKDIRETGPRRAGRAPDQPRRGRPGGRRREAGRAGRSRGRGAGGAAAGGGRSEGPGGRPEGRQGRSAVSRRRRRRRRVAGPPRAGAGRSPDSRGPAANPRRGSAVRTPVRTARGRAPLLWAAAVAWLLGSAAAITAAQAPPADTATFRFDNRHTGVAPGPAGPALDGPPLEVCDEGTRAQLARRCRRARDLRQRRRKPLRAGGHDGARALAAGAGRRRGLDAGRFRRAGRRDGAGNAWSRPWTCETGRPRWRFETGADLPFEWEWDFWLSSPTISATTVYVGSGDGNLYALELSTGRKLWQFPTGGRVRSTPAVDQGVVYVGSMDGKLYALDAATGKGLWTFETEGVRIDQQKAGFDRRSIVSSPAVSGDLVFVGSRDARLYAVDRKTGRERWRFGHKIDYMEGTPEVSWVLGSPAVVRRPRLDRQLGRPLLQRPRGGCGQGSLEVSDARTTSCLRARSPEDRSSSACEDGSLFALDAKSGVERWRFRTGAAVISSPAVGGGVVYFGSDDGFFYALATGPEKPGARTRRAVYWKDVGDKRWFQGNVAVKDYFVAAGYELLDEAGIARFLAETARRGKIRRRGGGRLRCRPS